MLDYYSTLSSEVYDLDKYIGRSYGDVEFYQERLAGCGGYILEPGVGNGRILIALLEQGLKVEGLDLSDDMLERCRHHCEERGLNPELFQGKMEEFVSEKVYESIIVPTGTFLLLHEREKSIQALKNFHRHLKDGGRLILDIFLQTDKPTDSSTTRTWQTTDGDIITLETKLVELDYINQYLIYHHRYEKWKNGTLIQTELERFPLRWYGVEEFKLLLKSVGFKDIVISADYKYGEYPTEADQIITFEAIKAES